MRPFNPRLLEYARSARRPVPLTAFFGTLTAPTVITQVLLASHLVSPVIEGHAALANVLWLITLLALLTLLRGLLAATCETAAQHGANYMTRDLHTEILNVAQALGPGRCAIHASEITTPLTRGLDDFNPYFVKFLPQLVLTSTVTPLALLVMTLLDPQPALIIFLVIPLVPAFMVLIGHPTQDSSKTKLAVMERLSAQLLDLMAKLPTLYSSD